MKTLPKLSELTPEQKRILCAESFGWKREHIRVISDGLYSWKSPNGEYGGNYYHPEMPEQGESRVFVPKYDSSLDAMAEAEATLTDEEHSRFSRNLAIQCVEIFMKFDSRAFERALHSRTAIQRLDAFLIAKGLARP